MVDLLADKANPRPRIGALDDEKVDLESRRADPACKTSKATRSVVLDQLDCENDSPGSLLYAKSAGSGADPSRSGGWGWEVPARRAPTPPEHRDGSAPLPVRA